MGGDKSTGGRVSEAARQAGGGGGREGHGGHQPATLKEVPIQRARLLGR